MIRAGLASLKIRHPSTPTTLQEVANWLTDIDAGADQDTEDVVLFNPGGTLPTKRTLQGAIGRTMTLSIKWRPEAEVFFNLLQGATNVPVEFCPEGTAVGKIRRSFAADFSGYAGPGGAASGSWDATISLSAATDILVETIATPPSAKTITTSSVADPTLITTSAAHALSVGSVVLIATHSGSTPSLNGYHTVTSIPTTTTFTIPVSVTVGGTGGTVQD